MGLEFTLGTLIAIMANLAGAKIFTNSPNETVVSTLLFTLSLAALMDLGCKRMLPESLPFIGHIAITTLTSLYAFEMMQATFWIPLERFSFKLASAVHSWASLHCTARTGSTFCTIANIAKDVATSGFIPVLTGAVMLLGTLHVIQAPYAAFLWRPQKKAWCPPRAPTPFPSTTSLNGALVHDEDDHSQHDEEEADRSLIAKAEAYVKAAVAAFKAGERLDEDAEVRQGRPVARSSIDQRTGAGKPRERRARSHGRH